MIVHGMMFFVVLTAAQNAEGRDPAELWVEGNAAFRAGQFDVAAQRYHALVAAGVDDGELYYNLGNAHLRRGELAQAIAAYRRAAARLPRDEDVEANLRFARARAQDALAPPEPSAALRALFFWHFTLSERELITAAVIAYFSFWLVLGLALYRRRTALRVAAALLGLVVAGLSGSLIVRWLMPTEIAVVRAQQAAVSSGIGEATVVRFRLHEGAEAVVTGREESWVRIRLADGKEGWVPASDVLVVTL